jgi:hypothetical protein
MPSQSLTGIPSFCENSFHKRPPKSRAGTWNPRLAGHHFSSPLPSSKSLARHRPGRIRAPCHSWIRPLHQKCHLGCTPSSSIPEPIQRVHPSDALYHHPNRSSLLSNRRHSRLPPCRLARRCRANLRLENPRRFHRLHWLGAHSTIPFPILSPQPIAHPRSKRGSSLADPHHRSRLFFSPPARCLDLVRHRRRRANLDPYLLPLPPSAATRHFPRRTRHCILLWRLWPQPRPGMAIRSYNFGTSIRG